MFSFIVDEYVKMEGVYSLIFAGYSQYHANFPKAKRYCSLDDNCFGVKTDAWYRGSGTAYSINFPIWSKEVKVVQGQIWYLNKKESISGN